MTLHFSIEYRTEWGQAIEVELCLISADGKTHMQRFPLETDDGLHWKGLCTLHSRSKQMRYSYVVTQGSTILRREWDVVQHLLPADDARTYFFCDHWRDLPENSYCYTDAFLAANGLRKAAAATIALFPHTYLFCVQAPQLAEGERVALIGDQPALGNWDTARALPMIPSGEHGWQLSISAEGMRLPFQYKYVVIPAKLQGKEAQDITLMKDFERRNIRWEEGPNRESPSLQAKVDGSLVVALSDGEIRVAKPKWKVAGLVVPLFSLRSEGSQGIGDFGDLGEMAGWVASTGMHAIQLLPIHDTTQNRTFTDSYPYNAISVRALHPVYADLRQLPLADAKKLASFRRRWQKLNALPALDYVEVIKLKEAYLHQYYEEQRAVLEGNADYRTFTERNNEWLQPYQAFCHLRDTYGTPDFSLWPKLSKYNRGAVSRYIDLHAEEVGYYAFVQYILHCQLSDAAERAHRCKVFLKGDLPIGISPMSVEAWQEPHLFHMDMTAGAPPDDFAREGQNWGFPTYNWERMAADGYHWWRQRLKGMAQYFSAYRIDHILGFFRIWQIPKGSPTALLGQFSPALPMSIAEIESYGLRFNPDLFVPHHPSSEGVGDNKPSPAEDRKVELFHPRIGVIGEGAWRNLPKNEQDAFIRLYEDFYFRRHNDFWAASAMQKLPALIGATDMLVCGEDLGMVPACVGPVMRQLGILSLEIQAMPKTYGVPFAQLKQNPYRSVATIFTHDMPTPRLWWKEDAGRTQCYYNTVLDHKGDAPAELSASLCEEIVAQHLNCPSMLCLISLQDWLSMDEDLRNPHPEMERINVPANPRHYWRYRMHLPVSRLQQAAAFNDRLRELIARSGR